MLFVSASMVFLMLMALCAIIYVLDTKNKLEDRIFYFLVLLVLLFIIFCVFDIVGFIKLW